MPTTPGRRNRARWRPTTILALSEGKTTEEAARIGRVSVHTVRRWLGDPRFKALIEEARSGTLERGIGRASEMVVGSIERLYSIAHNNEAPYASQVAAARGVCDFYFRAREFGTLSGRLSAIEQALSSGARPGAFLQAPREVNG